MLTMGLAQAPGLAQPAPPDEVTVEPPFLGAPAYEEDFQEDRGGWEADTPPAPAMTWEHGDPSSGPGEASLGGNVWATNLDGDHRPYECGVLVSGPIDLTDTSSAEIAIEHAYELYQSSWEGDGAVLFVTTDDGDSFEQASPVEGYDAQLSYSVRDCLDLEDHAAGFTGEQLDRQTSTVDLDPYTGQQIRIAFGFASGESSEVREGWYIDGYHLTTDGQTRTEDLATDAGFTVEAFTQPEQPLGWAWGNPSSSEGPSFQEATRLWGTNLDGDHGKNECSTIESPPIDLSDVTAEAAPQASLSWDQWFRSSSASGGGVVQIGVDGEYHNVEPTQGYPAHPDQALDECLDHRTQATGAFAGSLQYRGDDMVERRADVTEFLGEEITVRFVFATTDSKYLVDGWYVNDVAIELGAGADPVTVDVPEPEDVPDQQAFEPVDTVYQEDFEGDDGNWTDVGVATWEHGTPVNPPEVPVGSLEMWGTNLLGDTRERACSYVDSPTISLPGVNTYGTAETIQLTLETFRDLAEHVDGAVVWVNGEDDNWYRIEPREGYDGRLGGFAEIVCLGGPKVSSTYWTGAAESGDDWHMDTFDLSAFAGEDVEIRLAYTSGLDEDHRGIYLDEARIDVGVGASASPAELTQPQAVADELCQEDTPAWNVQRNSATWCRGVPTTGPSTVQTVWATDPHGGHEIGECSYLTSEPIDASNVPGLGSLTLSFEHFLDTRRNTGAIVEISDDGGQTWGKISPVGGYDSTSWDDLVNGCLDGPDTMTVFQDTDDTYEPVEFDLRGSEDSTFQLRFAFAGMDLPDPGWYLRDIQLDRGLGSVPVSGLAAASQAAPAAPADRGASSVDALREIAGPSLTETLDEGPSGPVEAIVTGPAHDTDQRFADRQTAMAHFDEAAQPFFDRLERTVDAVGGEITDTWSPAPAVEVRAPVSTLAALAELDATRHVARDHPGSVELVEPLPPEDEGVSLMNTEGRQMLQAEQAWAEGFRGEDTTISVIDTGIDDRHEAFRNADGSSRVVGWLDLYNGEPEPYDDHGHGTHVAASAAGSSAWEHPHYGAFEETGVAPEADLLGVKFLSSGGGGTLSDALDALEWSFEQGANVTSNSWGASCEATTSIVALVDQLTDQGMRSVFAAGNSGPAAGSIGGPGCGEESLTVGATDDEREVASFSSRGPCTDPAREDAEPRTCPDVVAKGEAVRSAVPREGAAGGAPEGYRTWSGTSMATPQVAGAVALMEQMKIAETGTGWDTASGADVTTIKDTAHRLPSFDAEPNDDYGWGLPQLMGVHTVLTTGEEAEIRERFSIADDELRIGDRTEYRFTVRNYGAITASGPLEATLTHPDGTTQTLVDEPTDLGYLDVAGVADGFPVQGRTLPGTYTFAGSYDYAWEDPDTGDTIEGQIAHEDTFTVVRPYLELAMHGLEGTAAPGVPQSLTFAATNVGNEAASDVELRLTVPDAYAFLPPGDVDPTDPDSRYSSPPPDETVDHEDGVTLVYDADELGIDDEHEIDLTLAATEPGDHQLLTVATFTDAADRGFAQGAAHDQSVETPLATLLDPVR
ncbi:hypothetical protein BRD56_12425 [Thermoplasmatales archaeon SW_10_69_26]|nr:MAG: hypothetical protein BRD56_12425 [Thermoplasmatales archaeon SW_10_69_26]